MWNVDYLRDGTGHLALKSTGVLSSRGQANRCFVNFLTGFVSTLQGAKLWLGNVYNLVY